MIAAGASSASLTKIAEVEMAITPINKAALGLNAGRRIQKLLCPGVSVRKPPP